MSRHARLIAMLGTCCFAGVLIATIALGASPHQGLHPNAEASTDAAPLCTSATNVAEPTFYAEMAQANMRMHEDMEVAASGDVDRDFARMMIPHHQGAIEMALLQLKYGHDERLKRLAQSIIVEQKQEIDYMRVLRSIAKSHVHDPLPRRSVKAFT
jgi:uncharacterized protein (DUF305 family)